MKILHEIPQGEIEELQVMAKRCNELHAISPSFATVELVVAKNGVDTHYYGDLSRSWVRNYYNAMTSQGFGAALGNISGTYGAGSLAIMDIGASTHASTTQGAGICDAGGTLYACEQAGYAWNAPSTNDTMGIVVGTGDTAEAFGDYLLEAQCTQGTGTNQLSHAAMSFPTGASSNMSWSNSTKQFTYPASRVFNNNSLAEIDVAETGIYIHGFAGPANDSRFCVCRGVLAEAVPVAIGAQLTVTYTMYSAVYPS
jgi:hypothetical protein